MASSGLAYRGPGTTTGKLGCVARAERKSRRQNLYTEYNGLAVYIVFQRLDPLVSVHFSKAFSDEMIKCSLSKYGQSQYEWVQ